MDILINATRTTPRVLIDSSKGLFAITGKSVPESSVNFYYPLIKQITEIFKDKKGTLRLDIALEYFNTSSSKCVFDLLKAFQRLSKSGIKLDIKWYYEQDDPDMKETGEDYEDLLNLSFEYIPVPLDYFYDQP